MSTVSIVETVNCKLLAYLGTRVLTLNTNNKLANFLVLLATIDENFVLEEK